MLSDLVWGAPQWAVPAIAIVTILAGLVAWTYWSSQRPAPIALACGLLKMIAIALLAFCLLQPMRSGTRPRPQANLLPIVVDNSRSMRIKGGATDVSRHDRMMDRLGPDASWLARLGHSFDVRPYAFDDRLHNLNDFVDLKADGSASALATSLQLLSSRYADRPVAGLVLMTDGNLTDAWGDNFSWESIGFPIYPVVPADDGGLDDLRITDVNVRQTDFESAPTTVTVQYDAVGFDDQTVNVRLEDESGDLIQQQTDVYTANQPNQVTFRYRPEQSGVRFHKVTIEAEGGTTAEATTANNRRMIAVDRAAGPYRILYIAGRPNWEFKFLRRALQAEAEVQLVGLIRIAKAEPKFSFRDKSVSDTNPLFAGLGESEEESAEQYDQPVLIRLGVAGQEELSDGFPKSDDELFAYHGVILDDLESDFFTADQMVMLRRFVSARGGGLLMLGGAESFAGKQFADSPLGELAPIYHRTTEDQQIDGPYTIDLTREGLLQPWTRLRETEQAERERIAAMPTFRTLNRLGEPKPGAAQLATVRGQADQHAPALIAQRFGKGRTAALLIGDLWRWSMRRRSTEDGRGPNLGTGEPNLRKVDEVDGVDDPAQAWRQLTRWLVNDVPRRVEVTLDSDDYFQSTKIIIRARDESYRPLDNARVELAVTSPKGETMPMNVELDADQPGVYEATYWSQEPGGYRVVAKVVTADGTEIGADTAGWTSDPDAVELADLKTNRALLDQIAEATGGEVINDDELDRFAKELPTRKVPVTETWIYPIWHRPWILMTAIACLCGEWGIRRWKGLA